MLDTVLLPWEVHKQTRRFSMLAHRCDSKMIQDQQLWVVDCGGVEGTGVLEEPCRCTTAHTTHDRQIDSCCPHSLSKRILYIDVVLYQSAI